MDDLLGFLLCFCLVATFYSKLYPIFFVFTSLAIAFHYREVLATAWVGWVVMYSVYAVCTYARNPHIAEGSTLNVVKLLVNFLFLEQAMFWAYRNRKPQYVIYLERTLALVCAAMALQILVYHAATGFAFLRPASSSAAAQVLYLPGYQFFGTSDKNIFGARFAIFGFLYVLAGWVRSCKLPTFRIVFVLIFAYLTLSRTPIVALLVGVIALVLAQRGRTLLKLSTLTATLAACPFVLVQLLRIDNLNEMSDGFAIRLVYWAAFFQNFNQISIWGNGFLSGKPFLETYAVFYNGEPQLHNLFLNNYLDFGIVGSITFLLFFVSFLRRCLRYAPSRRYWIVCNVPLLVVMLTLYTGYESDFVAYLFATFVLSQATLNRDFVGQDDPLPTPLSIGFLERATQGAQL